VTADIETLRIEVQEARDRGRLPGVQHSIAGWNPGAFEWRELPADVVARAALGKIMDRAVHDAVQQEAYLIERLAQHIEATGDERGILVEERLAGGIEQSESGASVLISETRVRLSTLVPARHIARQVVDQFEDVAE
jgi:hypothetical protein